MNVSRLNNENRFIPGTSPGNFRIQWEQRIDSTSSHTEEYSQYRCSEIRMSLDFYSNTGSKVTMAECLQTAKWQWVPTQMATPSQAAASFLYKRLEDIFHGSKSKPRKKTWEAGNKKPCTRERERKALALGELRWHLYTRYKRQPAQIRTCQETGMLQASTATVLSFQLRTKRLGDPGLDNFSACSLSWVYIDEDATLPSLPGSADDITFIPQKILFWPIPGSRPWRAWTQHISSLLPLPYFDSISRTWLSLQALPNALTMGSLNISQDSSWPRPLTSQKGLCRHARKGKLDRDSDTRFSLSSPRTSI